MKNKIRIAILLLGAPLAAIFFGAFGVILIQGSNDSWLIFTAGLILLAYSVIALILLLVAWRRPSHFIVQASLCFVAVVLVVWVAAALDLGRVSGLEALSVIGAASMLYLIHKAVQTLVTRIAQPSAPEDAPKAARL